MKTYDKIHTCANFFTLATLGGCSSGMDAKCLKSGGVRAENDAENGLVRVVVGTAFITNSADRRVCAC